MIRMTRSPFPLQWPEGYGRSPDRTPSRFVTGTARAVRGLLYELEMLGAGDVAITSDLPTRSGGHPYGTADDPGIAVWFVMDGNERVLCCDRWSRPAENIRALELTVAAMRGISRWGATDVVARAFDGFRALPAASGDQSAEDMAPNPAAPRAWRVVFGVTRLGLRTLHLGSDLETFKSRVRSIVRAEYRRMMRSMHPDVGGSHDAAVQLGVALEAAEADINEGRIYA